MCGIVGYIGNKQAAPVLLEGLSKLEYRGYDSAGIVVRDGSGETKVVKAKGRLEALYRKTNCGRALTGCCGIGHTRWATHGEPSEINAHPHCSDDGNVYGVHNGIIENYEELKDKLLDKGYKFYSQTDTEIFIKLVDYYYKKYKIGPIDALAKTMVRVNGSYALAVMFRDYPGEIYVARKDSPMILGTTGKESFIASDVPAILKYTKTVYYIENLQMAKVAAEGITFFDLNGDVVNLKPEEITWQAESAERGEYEHFMLKEIFEQPRAVRDTLLSVLKKPDGAKGGKRSNKDTLSDEGANKPADKPGFEIDLSAVGLTNDDIKSVERICFVACGSAYHVAIACQYVMEDLARIPVRVDLASEFRYRNPMLNENDLVVIISQSGETADSIAALRLAKELGARTLGIVNVTGSSIAREADNVFYTKAGPEIAVATTKAYSAQLVAGYALAVEFARVRGKLKDQDYQNILSELMALPKKIEKALEEKPLCQEIAARYVNADDIFFLGRGLDYAIALEGSLKMKEISYIHSEAYAAGELKHGTISLVEDGTIVISVLTQDELLSKSMSNMEEVKTRGAFLTAVTTYGNFTVEENADYCIYVPHTEPHFAASLAVVPLQLLSYYVSLGKGLDVDKPRNLAKSVTVE